jgi:hypothetical protein
MNTREKTPDFVLDITFQTSRTIKIDGSHTNSDIKKLTGFIFTSPYEAVPAPAKINRI